MKKGILWVTILLLGGVALYVLVQMYPTRGASMYFTAKTSESAARLFKRDDEIRMRLLADKRLVSAYDLPENQAKRITFGKRASDWPLYGVGGSEYDRTTIESGGNGDRSYWIAIHYESSARYSKKIRDLKRSIAFAIGEKEMSDVSVSTAVTPIIPNWGDGT